MIDCPCQLLQFHFLMLSFQLGISDSRRDGRNIGRQQPFDFYIRHTASRKSKNQIWDLGD